MNKKVIIFLLVVAIMVIVGIFITVKIFSNQPEENIPIQDIKNQAVIKDRKSVYQNALRDINITIPEFQNLEEAYERYINLKIYQDLSEASVYDEVTEGYEEDEIGFFTYETSYVRYDCGDYTSIVANQYIHLGEARAQIRKRCYVIDTKRNASVSLVDLFTDKTNYKKSILDEINKQAEKQNIELVGGNGLKEILDTQAFYIKDNQLVIYFESSEVAATAVGELEFIMPFEMVNGMFVL